MKPTIEDLKASFTLGYDAHDASRKEAAFANDLYHNRHYTPEQLAVLENRGQPAETFNVVKMFARMLVGYYSTVVNTVQVLPRTYEDIPMAAVANDVVNFTFEDNRFDIEGDSIKLGGMLSGLLISYCNVVKTGESDEFGRPLYRIVMHHVPDSQVVLDPDSVLDDYSDASFLHRFKWMKAERVERLWPGSTAKLTAHYNFLNVKEAEFAYEYENSFAGSYRVFDSYLVVHSVIEDDKGKRWSCFWSGDVMLDKKEITYKQVRWPYRVQKLHSSDKAEYYGVFRDVLESQRAINQAVLRIQLMVNSEKVFVQTGSVENLQEFTNAVNRVNAVIPVLNLNGIRVEKLAKEVLDQYTIIDRALDRIQRVLGINDSFLGMAYASDSGRKVKLQQNATIMSLRYITARIEAFYRSLGTDIVHLVSQYYTAHQVLRVSDPVVGDRWVELNKPMMEFSGQMDAQGQPIMQPILLPEIDVENGEPVVDDEGNIVLAPVSEEGTDLGFSKFDVKVESTSYNDEDERAQLMLETVMSGQVGQMLSQVNPAGFFKAAGLALRTMKTKYSPEISRILEETGAMLGQNPQAQQEASLMAQGQGGMPAQPQSRQLKLPTNTNEEF